MNTFLTFAGISDLTSETIGTLDLKITRLERRLQLLNQQQLLSHPYPDHKVRLAQESGEVRYQLDRLIQFRENFLASS